MFQSLKLQDCHSYSKQTDTWMRDRAKNIGTARFGCSIFLKVAGDMLPKFCFYWLRNHCIAYFNLIPTEKTKGKKKDRKETGF
jgi:hypothetical protein